MKKNYTSLNLLKILSMIMIISHHSVQHMLDYDYKVFDLPFSVNNYFSIIFDFLGGQVGVYIFIIISAFFIMKKDKYHINKIFKIILESFFISIFIVLLVQLILKIKVDKTMLKYSLLVPFNDHYWFINAYIAFYIIAPFLNKFQKNLSNNELKALCILLTFINPISNFVFKYNVGSSLLDFCYVFFVMAWLERNSNNFIYKHKKKLLIISLIVFLCLPLTKMFIPTKFSSIYLHINNRNLIPLFVAIVIFYNFKDLNIKNNVIINMLSSTTLGVYLLHEHVAINYLYFDNIRESLLWERIMKISVVYEEYYYPLKLIIFILIIYILLSIIYIIIDKFLGVIIFDRKYYNKICSKIDSIIY